MGLAGLSGYVVLKGEQVVKNRKICDCIIVHNASPPRIILVELKGRGAKHRQAVEKFSNAVDALSRIERGPFSSGKHSVSILLLIKKRRRRSFYRMWGNDPLAIGGKKHSVQILPCGAELADVYKMLARGGP